MKAALILLSCLALVSCSRRRYPGSGGYPGGGTPIVFPNPIKGGGGSVGGSHIHDQGHIHPQGPGIGGVGGVGVGGVSGSGGLSGFPSPIGHEGEPLYLSACGSRHSLVHTNYGGHSYHFSWCADGGQRYTWQGARDYCRGLGGGWYPVAVEDRGEDNFIIDIVGSHRSPWIWTGGNRLNTKNWVWLDGRPVTYTNWGRTGSSGAPQPDNAENNNERCLAYLNQFYVGDFITWHDIGCHHVKPVICENSGGGQVTQPQYG